MSRKLFDYDDGDFAYIISDSMAMDSDGDLLMRMGDNMAMDMGTGDLHLISGWDEEEEKKMTARLFLPSFSVIQLFFTHFNCR